MRNKPVPYVKVPMWFAEEAAKATKTTKALVWIWLLHLHFKTHRTTFPVPNGKLQKLGVSRHTKRRALRELEAAGLITIVRQHGKTPIVSLMVL
jgi:Bacterial regulatory proteins, gntR family